MRQFACGICKQHATPIMFAIYIRLGELKLKYKTEVRFILCNEAMVTKGEAHSSKLYSIIRSMNEKF